MVYDSSDFVHQKVKETAKYIMYKRPNPQTKPGPYPSLPVLILTLVLTLTAGAAPVQAATADSSPVDLTSCVDWPEAPEVESECAVLMEAKTGTILYGKNMDQTCYPASITKILTGLLTVENCSLDETVTFSYRATHELEEGSTSIARTEGEEMSVEDCLYALLLASANEVAQGLAEHVGGSIEDFADLMNERAAQLGCENSHFTNPSGLNDENHYTTCRDMAVIMRAAVANEDFLRIDSTQTYVIPPTNKHDEETPVAMRHRLLQDNANHYEGALAGKTGYTTLALNTLVTYAVRGDMELICVIMRSSSTQYEDTVALLDYGFDNFSMIHLSEMDNALPFDEIAETDPDAAPAQIPDNEWMVLPSLIDYYGLTARFEEEEGEADADGGKPVGRVIFNYSGTDVGSALITVPPAEEETPANEETAADALPETAETETEESGEEESSFFTGLVNRWTSLPRISSLADRPLMQRYPFLLWLLPLAALILLLGILAVLLSLLLSSRRRRRQNILNRRSAPYGGYIAPRSRNRRSGNKYHMKRKHRF